MMEVNIRGQMANGLSACVILDLCSVGDGLLNEMLRTIGDTLFREV